MKESQEEFYSLILDAMQFVRENPEFPRLSSRFISESVKDIEVSTLRSFPQQLQLQICSQFDCLSACADKLKICYFVAIKIGVRPIFNQFKSALQRIFDELGLLYPQTIGSLYDQLTFNSPISSGLWGLLSCRQLPALLDFSMYEVSQNFAALFEHETNQEALGYLHSLCVYLDKVFISPVEYRLLSPQGLFKALRFLRIAGLSNAAYYENESHVGAADTAKSLNVTLEQLLRYTDALERVFGAETSLINLLVNNCRKKLVLRYNHAGVFVHLERISEAYERLHEKIRSKKSGYSAFLGLIENALTPCRCFYLNTMCNTCPLCFIRKIQDEFRLSVGMDRIPDLLRLVQAILGKSKLFYCNSISDARECAKSLSIIYNRRDFAFYLLSLQNTHEIDFLVRTSDECLALLQSGFYDKGEILDKCDADTIRLMHKIYAVSWIQLYDLENLHHEEQNLSYFLQMPRDDSILSHPSTERFMLRQVE